MAVNTRGRGQDKGGGVKTMDGMKLNIQGDIKRRGVSTGGGDIFSLQQVHLCMCMYLYNTHHLQLCTVQHVTAAVTDYGMEI